MNKNLLKTALLVLLTFCNLQLFAGDGSDKAPYLVSEVIELGSPETVSWVQGVVVGTRTSSGEIIPLSDAITNVVLAMDATAETLFDATCHITVDASALEKEIKEAADPTSFFGKTVHLKGVLTPYYGSAGVKQVSDYGWGAIEVPADYVSVPLFSKAGGYFHETMEVEISCSTAGATIHYTLDGTAPTAASTLYAGAITLPLETVVLKAVAVKGDGISKEATVTFTYVYLDPASQVEDFSLAKLTDKYSDGSFEGNYGITWSYTSARDENGDANKSGIDGNAIMLPKVDNNVKSSAISGGIASLMVKLYKGFTGGGDRQVEAFVNGKSVGTSIKFDDFKEQIFSVDSINVEGDFTLEIRNIMGKQVIVDNITWLSYEAPAGNAEAETNATQVVGTAGALLITTQAACTAQIYNCCGALVAAPSITAGNNTIHLPSNLYVVVVNGEATKVVVR